MMESKVPEGRCFCMEKMGWKKWELSLVAGLIVSLLITPVEAEGTALSRWSVPGDQGELCYQLTLFPFGVGKLDRETAHSVTDREEPEVQIKFRCLEWLEELGTSFKGEILRLPH